MGQEEGVGEDNPSMTSRRLYLSYKNQVNRGVVVKRPRVLRIVCHHPPVHLLFGGDRKKIFTNYKWITYEKNHHYRRRAGWL